MAYIGSRPDNVISRNAQNEYNYTATGGQTTFTGADSNNNTLSYTPGNIEVYFNGARLEESDFTATNGTSIVLANAAVVNDELSIVAIRVFEVGSISSFNTSDLTEGSNLYFTNARADARIAAADTDDLSEGSTNLYFTNARADARIAAADTDDLSEGSTNLYFTNARVASYLSSNDFDTATNIVASITDSAPSTLDTLQELGDALGDDPNFATTVTNSIATKLPLSGGAITGNVTFGDNDKAIFGAGSDLQIYHNGSHSYIDDVGGGVLILQTDGNNVSINSTGKNMGVFTKDAEVTLYYNNYPKLATTNTGVDITGTLTSDGLTSSAVITAQEGRSNTAGTGQIVIDPDDTTVSVAFRLDQTDNKLNIDMNGGGTWQKKLSVHTGGDVAFYEDTGTTAKFFWDASAERLGLGNGAPSTILHLTDTHPSILFETSGGGITDQAYIQKYNNDFYIYNKESAGKLFLGTNNQTKATIDSSGRVGIGTNNPSRQLSLFGTLPAVSFHTSQSGSAAGDGFQIQANSTDVYLWNYENTPIRFGVNSTIEALRLTSSGGTVFNNGQDINQNFTVKASGNASAFFIDGNGGNVLVGTTTNNYTRAKLTVFGQPGAPATSGTSTTNVGLRLATTTGNSQAMDFGIYNAAPYGGWIQASNAGDFSTTSPIALNPNGGNVGIGVASPNAGLEIQGPHIGVNGVDDDYFKALKLSLPDNTEWGSQVQFSVGRWVNSGNHAMSSLVIALGNGAQNSDSGADTRVMTLTSNGRVVFSPTGAQDGQGVTTYANGANGHYVSCTGTANYWITNHGVASATGTLSTFYNNGTYCGGIVITGTNVTQYQSASDYRLKENVVPMTGATERLKQLNPVTFDWINSGESSEGFLAHEVGEIVPISTSGTKDEVYDEAGSDDNPNVNVGDPKYQSVDPAKLVPLLVKTIQELETRITQLESA